MISVVLYTRNVGETISKSGCNKPSMVLINKLEFHEIAAMSLWFAGTKDCDLFLMKIVIGQ